MSWYPAPGVRVFKLKAMVTAVAIAFLLGAAVGFGAAWRIYGWKEAAEDLVVERAANAVRGNEEARRRDIGARHMTRAAVIEQTFEEIEHATRELVEARPELRRIDLGPDVLCLWRAANDGRSTAEAGCGPVAAAEVAAAAEGFDSAEPDREPRAGGGAVPRAGEPDESTDRSGRSAQER